MSKQLILFLDEKLFDIIQNDLLPAEKRSLTSQLGYLLLQNRDDKQLVEIQDYWSRTSKRQRNVRTAVRIPDSEYWKGMEQAVKARMSLRDFCISLLESWANKLVPVKEKSATLKAMRANK
jgi:hypothetical protein